MTTPIRPLRVVRDAPSSGRAPDDGADAPPPDGEVSRALHELIERFDAFVRRTASRHGIAGAEIDDVVQDLRVRLWKSFGTAELIRRAKPSYMYRAAVSASLDIIRRRRALKTSAARLDDVHPGALADARARADGALAADELSRAVHDALELLAESRRAVVRMYLAGYDRFEIADLLGWTEGKTRNLLYRGLEDLRGVLVSRGITRETLP